jgi:hypothetical protein
MKTLFNKLFPKWELYQSGVELIRETHSPLWGYCEEGGIATNTRVLCDIYVRYKRNGVPKYKYVENPVVR